MESYRGLSPSQFFYRNREIAGFSNPVKALYQTARELIENALDATETHGIPPNIVVTIKLDRENENKVIIRVKDNGIGIPMNEVPNVFGRVFYGSKYVLRQTRGVFGLGVKMAVLYAQITSAKPIYIRSSTPDSDMVYEYRLFIDIEKNIPHIVGMRVRKGGNWHGTVVELTLEGRWTYARRRIEEYVRRTALIAPYASISLITPDGEKKFVRVSRELPEPPRVGRYHPKGVDIELLKMLIREVDGEVALSAFLRKFFDGVGQRTAEKFCKWAGVKPNTKVKSLKLSELEALSSKMREFKWWRRPKPATLSPLGEKLLIEGVKRILKPVFVAAVTRPPSSHLGNPFIVEVALAWGGGVPVSDSPALLRFANRIPLLYDEGADVARKIIDGIDWSVYKVKFPAPLAVVVHVCSTKIPFKGVGKEAIAEVPELEREITIGVREVARRLRRHLSRLEKLYEVKRREVTIRKYLDEVARSLGYILGEGGEEKIRARLLEMLERELERRGLERGGEAYAVEVSSSGR